MCIASLSAGRSVPLAADSLEALRRLCLFHSGAVQRADRVPSVQGAVRTVESMVTGKAFGVADPLTIMCGCALGDLLATAEAARMFPFQ